MSTYVLPSVSFEAASLRRRILISYWIIVLLGIPLWWTTTSIERLALPSPDVSELHIPVHIEVEGSELARGLSTVLDREKSNYPEAWRGVNIVIRNPHRHKLNGEETIYKVEVHRSSSGDQASLQLSGRTLHVRTAQSSSDPGLHATIVSTLSELLAPKGSNMHLVARYAPRYRLSFSLLNEDASSGNAALQWDIRESIRQFLAPTLEQLDILHNFTIESQVQFHAPLGFEPPRNKFGEHLLGEDELKMFINSADWTLASSVTEDPVLHFILFVPSVTHRPLKIQASEHNAFIVPQWGGFTILPDTPSSSFLSVSDLSHTFPIFRTQLLYLLGLPPLPAGVSKTERGLSPWQLDALLRRRTLENTRDSTEVLGSIVKLVDQIANMPVGQDVKGDVQGAIEAISQVHENARSLRQDILNHSARANMLSSRAFFNPGMLALLYFPAEHKYAVYMPLFAPAGLPLLVALLKEIRRWRKERKKEEIDKKKVE